MVTEEQKWSILELALSVALKNPGWRRICLFGLMASQWSSSWGMWGKETRCPDWESTFGCMISSKVKVLVEERGGVVLDKASGADAEHVIRFDELFLYCLQVDNKGCWWERSYLPIDRLTSSSTGGRLIIWPERTAFVKLCPFAAMYWTAYGLALSSTTFKTTRCHTIPPLCLHYWSFRWWPSTHLALESTTL